MCSSPRSFKRKEFVWEIVLTSHKLLFNLLLSSDVYTYTDGIEF